MRAPKAELISIGNEILSGWTINTNASWLAQNLTMLGLSVVRITSIADTEEEIAFALQNASQLAEIIICTGGLGPTPDDITKNALCRFFRTELVLHEDTLIKIKKIFEGRNLSMPEINRNQAMVPRTAELIENPFGTAPGLLFKNAGKLFFFLPGVPMEMKSLYKSYVEGYLKKHLKLPALQLHIIRTTGIPESKLYEKLQKTLIAFPQFQVSFLPKSIGVDIRLKYLNTQNKTSNVLSSFRKNIQKDIGKYIYTESEKDLQEILGLLLSEHNYTLAVAESFTGGVISDLITNTPGSSVYFLGSVITYSNESKINLLKVAQETLHRYGAVSEQTAVEMVRGVRTLFQSDCAISSTGIAGPGGATPDKPVGLCYLAAAYHDNIAVKKFNFGRNRRFTKERGAAAGLELLRRIILNL